jgi:hypothetical protein
VVDFWGRRVDFGAGGSILRQVVQLECQSQSTMLSQIPVPQKSTMWVIDDKIKSDEVSIVE